MQKSSETVEGRSLSITRLLDAPRELVWEVWTNPEHIKNWWGPDGFTNSIDKMEVRSGGVWQFIMHGTDGTDFRNEHHYVEVVKPERIVMEHVTGPKFRMTATFTEKAGGKTRVHLHSLFESEEQLAQVIKIFKADVGMRQNMDRLEAYVTAQFQLRKKFKSNNMARVSTYLNFPGNAEEAFNFYKSVFGGEFNGGIHRFGSLPPQDGAPELSEADKNLVLHIELPILGGHVLMGTDAPESMGFTVTIGNNMHIQLEPDTRAEAKRLFDALSTGGMVTMDLQDMFWGAYFGSFTDRFGINWMVNCSALAA